MIQAAAVWSSADLRLGCLAFTSAWDLTSLDSLVPQLPVVAMSPPVHAQPLPHHPGLRVAVSMPGALACWQDTPKKDGEEHPETVGLRSV